MKKLTSKFYFVGIKGTGMSALAKVLKDMGYSVIGSDYSEVFFTDRLLRENGIKILNFSKNNIKREYTYIISSCYDESNEEVKEILKKKYPYFYYHQFIEEFFDKKIGIGGVHGKTTTTSFLKDLFVDKKVSALIGDGFGQGVLDYDYFIFEACEYKNHILNYNFKYLIITNIDVDHLDFFKNIDDITKTFKKASQKAKCLVINENIKIEHPNKYTFGKNKDNYCYYEILREDDKGYRLKIYIDNISKEIDFPYYGEHMIYNLLASITLYYLINKELNDLQDKIKNFRMINRRMNEYRYNDNIIVDDYAHHPTEIIALLKGIKQKYHKPVVVIFQPHTYSRTLKLSKEFKSCFELCDSLYLMDTYSSKREMFSEELEKKAYDIFENKEKYSDEILKRLLNEKGKVIVFLGAGNFNKYIEKIRS